LTELQVQIDAFDHIYNTERPHQGLPGRVTPTAGWDATREGEAPRPKPEEPFFVQTATKRLRPTPPPTDLPAGTSVRLVQRSGSAGSEGHAWRRQGGQVSVAARGLEPLTRP
jgi:hypothetical protein